MDAAKKLLKSNPKTEAVLALHARIHRNAGEFELALKSYLQLQKPILKMSITSLVLLFAIARWVNSILLNNSISN